MDSAIRLAPQNVSFLNKETTSAIFDTHKIEKYLEKLRCTISSAITQGTVSRNVRRNPNSQINTHVSFVGL